MEKHKKNIAIRLNASHSYGMGHLFRMIPLAQKLSSRGVRSVFLIKKNLIAESVLEQYSLPYIGFSKEISEIEVINQYFSNHTKPQLWIYDLLNTNVEWISSIQRKGCKVICFDDQHGGPVKADWVINAIAGCWNHCPQGMTIDNGPAYTMLNPEIERLQINDIRFQSQPKLGITLGGSDTYGTTIQIAKLFSQILIRDLGLKLYFFLGPHFQEEDRLKEHCSNIPYPFEIIRNTKHLHRELIQLDMIICNGGQTLFEACALGLPVLAVANEPHEVYTIQYFEQHGACVNLGSVHREILTEELLSFFKNYQLNFDHVQNMAIAASQLVDGKGLERVVKRCMDLITEGKNDAEPNIKPNRPS